MPNTPMFGSFALPIPEIVHEKVTTLTRDLNTTDAQVLATVVNPEADDVAVIYVKLADETVVEIVAYQYDGTGWKALGGKLDAENVIIDEDLVMAGNYSQIGNLVKNATGTHTLDTAGMSVADFLKELLYKEVQPEITAMPALTDLSANKTGAYEVGTAVNNIALSGGVFTEGAYSFDASTGVTASFAVYRVVNGVETQFATECPDGITDADGAVLGDNDELSYKVVATYTDGNVAKTNLGNNSNPAVKITAGSVQKTSNAITAYGYRKTFVGASANGSATVDAAFIRSLTGSEDSLENLGSMEFNVAAGSELIVVAVPATTTLKRIVDTGAMGVNIMDAMDVTTVQVPGANNYTATAYNVYTYRPSVELKATTILVEV